MTDKTSPAYCFDCWLLYADDVWVDVTIPDDIWRRISPSHDEDGLLCFTCINDRLVKLGYQQGTVPVRIASGPMCNN